MAPYVSLTSQRGLSLPLPPISVQHAIAGLLGSLDDKVELNRRMAETLEGMAQQPSCAKTLASGNPHPRFNQTRSRSNEALSGSYKARHLLDVEQVFSYRLHVADAALRVLRDRVRVAEAALEGVAVEDRGRARHLV
jgi:hypothetical protein